MNGRLITVEEAARRLDVAKMTIYRMGNDGRLPLVRLGPRLVRIDENDLERIITSAKVA
jgi:excisionase family DNA binding protein